MSDHTERLREVLEAVKPLLDIQRESGRNLDKKAWDILVFTTGAITLGITIQVELIAKLIQNPSIPFSISLALLFAAYICQIRFVSLIIKPRKWLHVPGDATSLSSILENYINSGEDQYLLRRIADYTGDDTKGKENKVKGAIEEAQSNNDEKARYLNLALIAAGCVIVFLLAVSVSLATFS